MGSISSIFSKSLLRASLRVVQPTPTITSSPILLNTSSISSLQAEMSVTVVQEGALEEHHPIACGGTPAMRTHRGAPEPTRPALSSTSSTASVARYGRYSSTTLSNASDKLRTHALVDLIHWHHACHERMKRYHVSHGSHEDMGTADV